MAPKPEVAAPELVEPEVAAPEPDEAEAIEAAPPEVAPPAALALRAAIAAAAPIDGDSLPPWAFPGPFEKRGRLVRDAVRGPPARTLDANLHQRGYCTDPCPVQDPDGGFHVWFNHPVRRWNRWPTAIFYTHTDASGLRCTTPTPAVLPDDDERWQYETPNVLFDERTGQWIMLTLRYRYRGKHRRDHLSLQTAPTPRGPWTKHGAVMWPELPFERPYRDRDDNLQGGLQEPSLHRCGEWLVSWYGAVTYGRGQWPSVGVAGSLDDGETWVRWPRPLQRGSDGRGAGQPDVVRDPRGGWHMYWQERRGPRHAFHHAFSRDGIEWHPHPENPILVAGEDGWDRGRITAPAVEIVPDGGASYRHWLFYFGGDAPARSGAAWWIGLAVENAR